MSRLEKSVALSLQYSEELCPPKEVTEDMVARLFAKKEGHLMFSMRTMLRVCKCVIAVRFKTLCTDLAFPEERIFRTIMTNSITKDEMTMMLNNTIVPLLSSHFSHTPLTPLASGL
jgi:hypothetical protein